MICEIRKWELTDASDLASERIEIMCEPVKIRTSFLQ